jgi:sugar lactone lactonase YvrE
MSFSSRAIPLALVAVLASCSGGGNSTVPGQVVGPAGGTVSAAGGAAVQFPPGALSADTAIVIDQATVSAPAGSLTPVFQFGPAGTAFNKPVTVSFTLPPGSRTASIYWTRAGSTTQFERLPTTIRGNVATAQVNHFSLGYVSAGTLSISGTVSGAVLSGVTLTLAGQDVATTTTDALGAFTFAGVTDGSYALKPSLAGYGFAPLGLAITVSGANVTGADFVASASAGPTWVVSGTVSGAVSAGVTVALTGAATGGTVTDALGNYSFSGVTDGSFTLTPSLAGYTFTPASLPLTVAGADVPAQNFVGALPTHALSGTVTGAVVSGVIVNVAGPTPATTVTDAIGNFSVTVTDGTYTVTPSLLGYSFVPPVASATVAGADVTGLAFTSAVLPVVNPHSLSVVAGVPSGTGDIDGTGAAGRFWSPAGVAVDAGGNLFVADHDNSTIRRVSPLGVVTTLAGSARQVGASDGPGPSARFNRPWGLAVDATGNVYVADTENDTVRVISPAGVVTTLAGLAGTPGSADGQGAAARFSRPSGIAVDTAGNVFVADHANHTVRQITPGGLVSTLAGTAGSPGSADGQGGAARFYLPTGVAVDASGAVYVADSGSATIRKITAGLVSTLAGSPGQSGTADGTGSAARFDFPTGVAVDGSGNVYVGDSWNDLVRQVTAGGAVTTLAGVARTPGSADGPGAVAQFDGPAGVAVDATGRLFVADSGNDTLRLLSAGVVSTVAGTAGQAGSLDGGRYVARFSDPVGVALDVAGNAYVADYANSTIRKVSPAADTLTFAGTAGQVGSADGTGAAARFNGPAGVAVDPSGNVVVGDFQNSTIRLVTPLGVVTTLAGSAGVPGSEDGTGPAAGFSLPYGVAVDASGNVLVADSGNSLIRRVTPSGVVTTLAGAVGNAGSSDGTGPTAQFNHPRGIALDVAGNAYVADTGNSTIRKVTPAGVVTTLAGTAGLPGSLDGTGSAAQFSGPSGLAVDGAGNVYVADTGNSTIRKVTPAGVVTTVVGLPGRAGNVPGALPAGLAFPLGVAVDPATGNLFVVLRDAVLVVAF